MVNSLPLNIFTAIIAPLIIPFIEQTLAKSIASDNSYKINRLYGKKQKKADESLNPDSDRIENAKIIDNAISPFFRGLPGAYVGNIIWGITYEINGFDWWFFIYLSSLIVCLGIVNYIRTQIAVNIKRVYIFLIVMSVFFIVLTFLRLFLHK